MRQLHSEIRFFLLASLVFTTIAIGGCIGFINWIDGEYRIATIDCGSSREIVISADVSWEMSQTVYFRVRVDGKVVGTKLIGHQPGHDPSLRFVHFAANDEDLVGVAYVGNPSNYLFIHDFSNGKSYTEERPELKAQLDAARTDSIGG